MARFYRDARGRFISEAEAYTRAERALARAASWAQRAETAHTVRFFEKADAEFEYYSRQLARRSRDDLLGVGAREPEERGAELTRVPTDEEFEEEYFGEGFEEEEEWEVEFSIDYEEGR